MKEEELIKLGFERVDVSAEESGDEAFYYFTYDMGNGKVSLISQADNEVKDNNWTVEVFEDESIQFKTLEDVTKFIYIVEKNII